MAFTDHLSLSFRPKLIDCLKKYSLEDLISDLSSGITVGVVALPLSMAFAIASGLKPEAGIFTAIFAGFIISALGGSKVQIGGPAGAFIVIVYGIVAQYGVSGLILATIMSGVILFLMGVFKLGSLVRFVPISIVVGFTNGIAVLIALSQVKDLLGLKIENLPADFFPKIESLVSNVGTFSSETVLLSLASAVIVFSWAKLTKLSRISFLQRLPGSIVALVAGTVAVSVLHLPVETIGTKFGGIPSSLPSIVIPEFSLSVLKDLFVPALTIAVLGAIESLLCARVADGLINDRHNPNQELMAQGVANAVAASFGGFCATGTIARTVTNVRSGGKTPVAGLIHAITLLVIVMVAAPLATNIPLATLAAILLFVAYNMGEWHEFVRMKKMMRTYRIIMVVTFILTVVLDLTIAFQIGLGLAFLFFVTRVSMLTQLEPMSGLETFGHDKMGGKIEVYRLSGSLFFGSVHKLEELVAVGRGSVEFIVLDLSNLLTMDASGMETLKEVSKKLKEKKCHLLVAGMAGQPWQNLRKSGFLKSLGEDNFFKTTEAALDYAGKHIKQAQPAQEEQVVYG